MSQTTVTLITSHKLTSSQRADVLSTLNEKLGTVKIEEKVDSSMLGGLRIQIGNQTFDASLAGKLEKLETQIPEIVVTTAIDLSPAQEKTIRTAFEKQYGEVRIRNIVDEAMIGGVKIQYGSKELDGTIRGKLTQLRNQMLASV
ncbi:MAG: F0F1 ATP synthase subunit delta [Patescibacteria group bacterium]